MVLVVAVGLHSVGRAIIEVEARARMLLARLLAALAPIASPFALMPAAAISPIVVVRLCRRDRREADDGHRGDGQRHAAEGAPSRLRNSRFWLSHRRPPFRGLRLTTTTAEPAVIPRRGGHFVPTSWQNPGGRPPCVITES